MFHLRPLVLLLLAPLATAQLGVVERVSVSSSGVQGDAWSQVDPKLSADGRFVAFVSSATTLVSGDTNGFEDIFHHDRQTGVTIRCSISSTGVQTDERSAGAAISGDGRFVAFWSYSDLLDPADQNGLRDVFVHDTVTRQTERISVGLQGADGNGFSVWPAIDYTGDHVAFSSSASNLIANDTNFAVDIFVRDRAAKRTIRASVPVAGDKQQNGTAFGASISANGRHVAYYTYATNMGTADTSSDADAYVYDSWNGKTIQATLTSTGAEIPGDTFPGPISADGRYLPFSSGYWLVTPDDTNSEGDIFLRDLVLGTTELVSQGSDGAQSTFHSNFSPSVSGNGRYVAWWTRSAKFLPGDNNGMVDTFVRDRWAGVTELVTSRSDGGMGDGESNTAHLSADGRFLAYLSTSTNLVPGDTNGVHDVFVVDRRLSALRLSVVGDQSGAPARLVLSGGVASDLVAVLFSTGPQQLIGTSSGLMSLAPNYGLLSLQLDPLGERYFAFVLAPALAGLDVWSQAISSTTGLLSNSFRVAVL